jgi:hypothetical protein
MHDTRRHRKLILVNVAHLFAQNIGSLLRRLKHLSGYAQVRRVTDARQLGSRPKTGLVVYHLHTIAKDRPTTPHLTCLDKRDLREKRLRENAHNVSVQTGDADDVTLQPILPD